MRAWRNTGSVFLLVIFILGAASAQQLAKRLILKDGTYQLATKWEVQGERVRYFSAERSEWEELPKSMVDWAATDKYEKDRTAGVPLPEAAKLDKELAAEQVFDDAALPEVSPGLHLPEDGGVLVLDTFENRPQLVPLQQKVVRVNVQGQASSACAANNRDCAETTVPVVKDNIEIAGPHATVQAHAAVPILYVNLGQKTVDATSPQELASHFRIVRAPSKKDRRMVGAITISKIGMATADEQRSVPSTTEQISEAWLKITPLNPLPPGEYVLAEVTGSRKQVNGNLKQQFLPDNIWDFGVNPAAPANALAIKPEVPAAGQASDGGKKN